MTQYVEKINRYVVEYHEELPAAHKAQMRLNGLDPDNYWNLTWSFTTMDRAIEQCNEDAAWYREFCEKHGYEMKKMYRVRDLGAPVEVVRTEMF